MELKRKNKEEQIVADYLTKTAMTDLELATAIENCTKTFEELWSYIRNQAKEIAVNNCAMVEDATVFGWALHFILEDGKGCEYKPSKKVEEKPQEVVKEEKKPKPAQPKQESLYQYSLFDMAEDDEE